MEELDGDTVRLSSRGRYAERDIVQVRHLIIHKSFYLFTSGESPIKNCISFCKYALEGKM